jgi:O-methyltransferase involved in polyketide biosynthesis
MYQKAQVNLGAVQQTLLLPLWGRARESLKDRPLLIDRRAVEIISELDYDFSTIGKKIRPISQLGWVMRSLLIDEALKGYIKQYPGATIINIGCGFDTTFERVDNSKITWYDLDLPDVIDCRKQFIRDNDRRKSIAKSILDYTWVEQIQPHKNVLIVAAGVLYYFNQEQIVHIFNTIAQKFPGSEMVFDATSPMGVKMANKMVLKSSGMNNNAVLKWGLKEAKDLLALDERIEIVDEIPFFGRIRNNLKFKDKVVTLISDLTKCQYLVHMKFH